MTLPITLEDLKENVGSPVHLTDEALQRVADGAWAEILRRFGPSTARVEEYDTYPDGRYIVLNRKASAVSLVEERSSVSDPWTSLGVVYSLVDGGNTLRRDDGIRWSRSVRVTYAVAQPEIYIGALIDLVLLRIPQSGWRTSDEGTEDAWGNSSAGSTVVGPLETNREAEDLVFDRLRGRAIGVA